MGAGASTSVVKKARKDPDGQEADILFEKLDKTDSGHIPCADVVNTLNKTISDWSRGSIIATVRTPSIKLMGKTLLS